MIGDLQPYAALKESGVPWLADVPAHWEVRKLRRILTRVTERDQPELPLLSVVRERGVVRRDTTTQDENHNYIPDDLSNYKVVRVGQFAMNKMKAWQGSYGVSQHEGIVSPAYFVFDVSGLDGTFFHTAIRSKSYVSFFTQASDGVRIGQWDLAEVRMREIPFLVPPIAEQAAIVRFLDHADRRIRRYVAAKKKLIVLLNEQKHAIIHNAVTRGLDPNVRLKPSGVEWLGDIPAHWNVVRAAAVCDFQSGKAHEQFIDADGEFLCVTARFVSTGGEHARNCSANFCPAQNGDVLMVMSDLPRGRALARAYHVNDNRKYAVNQRVCVLRAHSINSRYLAYFANRNPQLLAHDDGSNQTHLPNAAFKTLMVPVPPREEQQVIEVALASHTGAIDRLVTRGQREIELVMEYRTRLLADVVTGKFDVREASARLPDEVAEADLLDDTDVPVEGAEFEADLDATLDEVVA